MKKYLRDWIYNIGVFILVLVGFGLFMSIFMTIFYPGWLSGIFVILQPAYQILAALNLLPIFILFIIFGIIFSTLPRRRHR